MIDARRPFPGIQARPARFCRERTRCVSCTATKRSRGPCFAQDRTASRASRPTDRESFPEAAVLKLSAPEARAWVSRQRTGTCAKSRSSQTRTTRASSAKQGVQRLAAESRLRLVCRAPCRAAALRHPLASGITPAVKVLVPGVAVIQRTQGQCSVVKSIALKKRFPELAMRNEPFGREFHTQFPSQTGALAPVVPNRDRIGLLLQDSPA